mmetsp:Transcript_10270/g.14149  ORF Transcript_10270/g.14149 Transcript_10270/m.14149 type:complete len:236 (-) Transcript_10270:332-1039(-)
MKFLLGDATQPLLHHIPQLQNGKKEQTRHLPETRELPRDLLDMKFLHDVLIASYIKANDHSTKRRHLKLPEVRNEDIVVAATNLHKERIQVSPFQALHGHLPLYGDEPAHDVACLRWLEAVVFIPWFEVALFLMLSEESLSIRYDGTEANSKASQYPFLYGTQSFSICRGATGLYVGIGLQPRQDVLSIMRVDLPHDTINGSDNSEEKKCIRVLLRIVVRKHLFRQIKHFRYILR